MKSVRTWMLHLFACTTISIGASTLPLSAQGGNNAGSYTGEIGDNINLFTGGLTLPQTDLYLPGRAGLDLTLTRVYSSQIFSRQDVDSNTYTSWGSAKKPGMLGDGWSLLLGKILMTESDTTVFYGDGSAEQIFKNTSPGSARYPFRTMSGNRLTASRDTLVLLNGTRFIYSYSFQPADTFYNALYKGRFVTKILDPFGNNIQITYNPGGTTFPLIDQIQDAIGRIVKFEYDQLVDPKTARLKKIKYLNYKDSSPDTMYIKYQYNTAGDLRAVIQPYGDSTIYAYTDSTLSPAGTKRVAAGADSTRLLSEVTTTRGGKVKYVYWLMQERRESGPNRNTFKSVNHWAVYRRIVGEDSLKISYAAPSIYSIDPATLGQIRHKTTMYEISGKITEYYYSVDTDYKDYSIADSSFYFNFNNDFQLDALYGILPASLIYMKVTNTGVGSCGTHGYFERLIYYDNISFFQDGTGPYLVVPYVLSDYDCGDYRSCTRWESNLITHYDFDFSDPHVSIDMTSSTLLQQWNHETNNVTRDAILASAYDSTSNIFRVTQRLVKVDMGGDKDSVLTESFYTSDLKRLDSLRMTRGGQAIVTAYEYDSYGNVTKVTDQNGYWTRYVFDGTDNAFAIQVNKQIAGSDSIVVTKADYYARAGLPKWEEGANGDRVDYTYDNFNRLIKTKFPLEDTASTKRFYNAANNIVVDSAKVTSSTWRITETKYDGFNRIVYSRLKTDTGYYQDSTEYDSQGRVKKSFRAWDTANRPSPMKYTEYFYDALGRLVSTKVPDANTTYDSDTTLYSNDRTTEYIDFSGRRVKAQVNYFGNTNKVLSNYSGSYADSVMATYGPFGKMYTEIPPKGSNYLTGYVYNSLGKLRYKYSSDEGWKKFFYDKSGNLRITQSANGTWTYFKYDGVGRLIEQGVTSAGSDSLAVWTNSNHSLPSTGLSQKITRKYDTYTDSVKNTYSLGTHMENPKGQLTEVYDPTGCNFFFYDKRGRVLRKVTWVNGDSSPRIHDYSYTPGDMIDSLYYPRHYANARDSVKYDYYDYGWTRGVSGHTATGAGTPGITYEPFGAVKQMQIGHEATKLGVSYGYDDLGRLTSQYVTNSLAAYGTQIFRRAYDYEGVEINKTYRVNNGGTKTNIAQIYSYDTDGRLFTAIDSTVSSVKNYRYRYDRNGNRDSMIVNGSAITYQYYDNTNRLRKMNTSFYEFDYLYDANGCVTNDSSKARNMGYDYRNLTTIVTKRTFTNGHWGNDTLLNYFDYSGRRVKKTVLNWAWQCTECAPGGGGGEDLLEGGGDEGLDGSGGGGGGTPLDSGWVRTGMHTYYYYSGSEVSLVINQNFSGNITDWTSQVYAAGRKIASQSRDLMQGIAVKNYVVADHQGNTRNVYNYDGNGNLGLNAAYWYNPFGKQDSVVIYGTGGHRFTYNDKELDTEVDFGMYYYGARFYDPNIGRFSSPDPIKDYHNPYSYVRNNPIHYIDPTGMSVTNRIAFSFLGSKWDFWGEMFEDALSQYFFDTKANELQENAEEREKNKQNDGPTGGNPSDDHKTQPDGPIGPPSPEQDKNGNAEWDDDEYDASAYRAALERLRQETMDRKMEGTRYLFVKNVIFGDTDPNGPPSPGTKYDGGDDSRKPFSMPRSQRGDTYLDNPGMNFGENSRYWNRYWDSEYERRADSIKNFWWH